MNNSKWNFLLVVFLLSCMSMNAQCFRMEVNELHSNNGYTCLEISIDIYGALHQPVQISDNYGNTTTCGIDCSFIWCYQHPPNMFSIVEIVCTTSSIEQDGCNQREGCIVVIGSGGGG